MPGILYIQACLAAAQVPEKIISVPRFGPLFIPEMTQSNFTSLNKELCKAILTQSAGKPEYSWTDRC